LLAPLALRLRALHHAARIDLEVDHDLIERTPGLHRLANALAQSLVSARLGCDGRRGRGAKKQKRDNECASCTWSQWSKYTP